MYDFPSLCVQQNVVGVPVSQADNMAHHGGCSKCSAIPPASGVPVQRGWKMFQEEIVKHRRKMLCDTVVCLQHESRVPSAIHRRLVSMARSCSRFVHLRLAFAVSPVCRAIPGVSSVPLFRGHAVQIFPQSQRPSNPLRYSCCWRRWHDLVGPQLHVQRSRRRSCAQYLIDQFKQLLHNGVLPQIVFAFHHLLVCHARGVVAHHDLGPGQSAFGDIDTVLKSLHIPHRMVLFESTCQHRHMPCADCALTSGPRLAQVCNNNLAINWVPRHAHVQVNQGTDCSNFVFCRSLLKMSHKLSSSFDLIFVSLKSRCSWSSHAFLNHIPFANKKQWVQRWVRILSDD
mmetsp:Transcript_48497/g.110126  ORF Transcript_48497/g.110126 Transcript_48497/m.110126 type:complete len:342 (-) Transcript_48497:508-1533(-)